MKIIRDLVPLSLSIEPEKNMHVVIYFKEQSGDFAANIRLKPDSKLHLEHIILGGELNCKLNFILEKNAELIFNTGFKLAKNNKLKYSYFAEHEGKKSISSFKMIGSLNDKAQKESELKIHFSKGAVDAQGDENEKITMLSDQAKNVALPIILSDESEAEGHHSFSSSHLSADEQDYLQSRGLNSDKIKEIQAKNNLLQIAKLTKQDDITKDVYGY